MHIIPYGRGVIAVRHFIQHDICYVRNVIVIRHRVQLEVVATAGESEAIYLWSGKLFVKRYSGYLTIQL